MRAAVYTRYGPPDVVRVQEVPRPEPQAGEILVRVHASTVSRTDCGWLRAHPFFIRLMSGFFRPKETILGMDFAGEVEVVGTGVTSVQPGDRVFGLTPGDHGGHAEYLCLAETDAFGLMPQDLRFQEAVVCEGALYADTNLRAFDLGPGHKILIYGASGAIGTAAVQLAKGYGAEVTAVVGTRHVELARSLGADRVIDYTGQDFTQLDETYEFILDAVGKASYLRSRHLLGPGGRYAATDLGPWGQNLLFVFWSGITRSQRFEFPFPSSTKAFVESMRERLEAGEFHAVIDREYPLESIVEAYRYVETKQKTGIVVLNIS